MGEMTTYLWVGMVLNFTLSIVIVVFMYQTYGKVRRESARAQHLLDTLKHEWDSFNRNQSEQFRQRYDETEELARRIEQTTERRVQAVEEQVNRGRADLQTLQEYARNVLEVELKGTLDSFDTTVDSILNEMKEQLARGVDHIEKLKQLVDGRISAQQKLIEGHSQLRQLAEGKIGESAEKQENADVSA